MSYQAVKHALSDRPPNTPDEVPRWVRQECVPAFKELRQRHNEFVATLGGYTFFVDPADSKLKVLGPSGSVTIVAVP